MIILFTLLLMPLSVWAAEKPSLTAMWMELIFMVVMLVVLKITDFSNQQKIILFSVYIVIDILSQTLWLAIIIFLGLYVFFKKATD